MEKYLEKAVKSISESIRFDSSLSKGTAEMPFGKGAYDCLHHFLSLAEELGFQTKNYDNYVGEVLFGEQQEDFAILAHLDVVPAGGGWKKDPFGGEISDGKIWGRGAVDEHGPCHGFRYGINGVKGPGLVT
ncbi:MAG: M20/M25/M40 family metallo-hydrolase, partial [Clostridiales bacterium]|nr:M20/M25/M40 family metallo-hydrolase [Clostridiales bacterium]